MNILKQQALNIYGNEPETMNELAKCVIAIINSNLASEGNKVIGFVWELRSSICVSNSHAAPLGKERNWDGHKINVPKGYPGMVGRIWIRYNKDNTGFSSTPFENTLTHTGTGGSGHYNGIWRRIVNGRYKQFMAKRRTLNGYENFNSHVHCYSWDYTIFADDWPVIDNFAGKQQTFDLIKTGKIQEIKHYFEWNDPDTIEDDNKFLKQIQEEEYETA